MSINIIQLNGFNSSIDYQKFENQTKNSLEKTCKEATITILNKFPVSTTPEINTDIVITLCIKKIQGNYFRGQSKNGLIYFHNFIVPVCIINNYNNSNISIDKNEDLFIDDVLYDYSNDIHSLKFGFRDYLINRCSFVKNDLNPYPIIFIKNSKTFYAKNGILINNEFDWDSLLQVILNDTTENIVSLRKWNSQLGFESHLADINLINEKASEDSIFGFLTKRKIERIAKKVSAFPTEKKTKTYNNNEHNFLFDTDVIEELRVKENFTDNNINNNESLILIEGKAGTGKTSELINLMIKNLTNDRNARYLTYNHLLVYDISRTVKSFVNSNQKSELGIHSVMTLHQFFYRLSKSLGILHLMTEKRMDELKTILFKRVEIVRQEILNIINANGNLIFAGSPFFNTKEFISNSRTLKQPEKEVAIDFINFLNTNNYSLTQNLEFTSKAFIQHKKSSLEGICINSIFITDYYGVLKNILKSITDPSSFYEEFNIESKFELLYATMEYGKRHLDNKDLQNGIIPKDIYVTRVNKVKGGHKLGKSIVLIDEGQDCHRDERDILFSIFEPNNLAISNGGKEQLIRHVELCNWTASQGKNIPHKKYSTGRKSYRMKKNLLSICNFIALKFGVALNLDSLNTDDVGELIIDIRKNQTEEQATEIFEKLIQKGSINSCTPYESLLVLLNPSRTTENNTDSFSSSVVINEYGNIEEHFIAAETEFKFSKALEKVNVFWDGTNDEIRRNNPPSYGEVRMIYYNSCRGLEAWGVTCFDIDIFFDKKRAEPDAEKYLTDTVFSLEDRKNMYAATWTLMAMTRAIDTMYLKVSNADSKLGRVIMEYAKSNQHSCKVMD